MVMATVVVVKRQNHFSSNPKGVAGGAKPVATLALSSYRNDGAFSSNGLNFNGNCHNFSRKIQNITFHHNNCSYSSMIYLLTKSFDW